jgi:hypothetical protein
MLTLSRSLSLPTELWLRGRLLCSLSFSVSSLSSASLLLLLLGLFPISPFLFLYRSLLLAIYISRCHLRLNGSFGTGFLCSISFSCPLSFSFDYAAFASDSASLLPIIFLPCDKAAGQSLGELLLTKLWASHWKSS